MYKILLTVDDSITQNNFRDQLNLKLGGSEIIFVRDTQEILSILAQQRISLLLLDLHSFQVDSLYILAHMTHEHPNTPCFILGDHALHKIDVIAPPSKLYHYVQKPYDLEHLTSEIACKTFFNASGVWA